MRKKSGKALVSKRLNLLKNNGAQGRSRTADTAIFSRMLYQLSYLGIRRGVCAEQLEPVV